MQKASVSLHVADGSIGGNEVVTRDSPKTPTPSRRSRFVGRAARHQRERVRLQFARMAPRDIAAVLSGTGLLAYVVLGGLLLLGVFPSNQVIDAFEVAPRWLWVPWLALAWWLSSCFALSRPLTWCVLALLIAAPAIAVAHRLVASAFT